jgi:hypothetical protein
VTSMITPGMESLFFLGSPLECLDVFEERGLLFERVPETGRAFDGMY